ncbi:MAG: discoidin domain-containing protein [Bacteroidota bacterium]
MPGYAEGTWKFPPNWNSQELLYFYQHYYARNVYVKENHVFWANWATIGKNTRYDKFLTVDFSKVQLPHLGINAISTQSSTGWDGHSSRAIDGNVDGNYRADDPSVTHTQKDANSYWEVDLGAPYASTIINKIELWNRRDCCGDRLSNYKVFVSDVPFTSTDLNATISQANRSNGKIKVFNVGGNNGNMKSLTVNRTGRYVRVQLVNRNYLSLAEVRIVPRGFH